MEFDEQPIIHKKRKIKEIRKMDNEVKVKRVTKVARVLDYLKTHPDGMTSMDAIILFGATRLSDIVFKLKKAGYLILTEMEDGIDRYGNASRYARYKLIADKK